MTKAVNPVNAARELLLRQEIKSFRLDVPNLKYDRAVLFDTFQNFAKTTGGVPISPREIKDGCTVLWEGSYVILTHEPPRFVLHRRAGSRQAYGYSPERVTWTQTHEVGHVYLEHNGRGLDEERSADRFAAELLLPEPVMLELRKRFAESGREFGEQEVSRLFGVSAAAAQNRLAQIARRQYFSAYLHREIMEKYAPLIDKHCTPLGDSVPRRDSTPDPGRGSAPAPGRGSAPAPRRGSAPDPA